MMDEDENGGDVFLISNTKFDAKQKQFRVL